MFFLSSISAERIEWYKLKFNDVNNASLVTAICQSALSFILFFALCVVHRVVKLPSNSQTDKDTFVSDFQHYLVLATAISFLIPTVFGLVQILGIMQKNYPISRICLVSALIYFPCMIIGLVVSGLYVAIEGALEVGIPAIVLGLLLICGATHSILITHIFIMFKLSNEIEN